MKKTIIKIEVEAIDGNQYVVILTNSARQRMRHGAPSTIQAMLTEATELADFFGMHVEPFHKGGRVIAPEVVRETYRQNRRRDPEEILGENRLANGELNWNRVMQYEWKIVSSLPADKGGFTTKMAFRDWLLPHVIECKVQQPEWLKANCRGVWLRVEGAYRFSRVEDAVLFKMFNK